MRSDSVAKNTGKCPPVADLSLLERKSGSRTTREVAEVLVHYMHRSTERPAQCVGGLQVAVHRSCHLF